MNRLGRIGAALIVLLLIATLTWAFSIKLYAPPEVTTYYDSNGAVVAPQSDGSYIITDPNQAGALLAPGRWSVSPTVRPSLRFKPPPGVNPTQLLPSGTPDSTGAFYITDPGTISSVLAAHWTALVGPTATATVTIATATPRPTATPTSTPTPVALTCNFFAAPAGVGDGLSFGSPTTLTGAQTLARAAANNAGSRVICLESGTYSLTNWTLTSADTNETWLSYSGQNAAIVNVSSGNVVANLFPATANISWYGVEFTGLNGGPGGQSGFYLSGSNFTVRWNSFVNCAQNCGYGGGISASLIDSNTYSGETATGGESPIFLGGWSIFSGSDNDTFSHNLCISMGGGCFGITNGTGDSNNDLISCNLATNTLQTAGDTGAFYFTDEGRQASTNVQIVDNGVFGSGGGNGGLVNSTKGIYLDDNASNALVSGNVIARNNGAGSWPGEFGIFIHGGSNNTIQNNVIEVAKSTQFPVPTASYTDFLGLVSQGIWANAYQTCGACGTGNGNSFIDNILFTADLWSGDPIWYIGGPITAPTVNTNDYWSATAAPLTAYGYADANALHINPQFANPAANDFTVGSAPLITALSWTQIRHCQGPLPYGVTAVGGPTPTPTPTPTPAPTFLPHTPNPTPTATATQTAVGPTGTPGPTSTVGPTSTPAPTATATPTGIFFVAAAQTNTGAFPDDPQTLTATVPSTANANRVLALVDFAYYDGIHTRNLPAGWAVLTDRTVLNGSPPPSPGSLNAIENVVLDFAGVPGAPVFSTPARGDGTGVQIGALLVSYGHVTAIEASGSTGCDNCGASLTAPVLISAGTGRKLLVEFGAASSITSFAGAPALIQRYIGEVNSPIDELYLGDLDWGTGTTPTYTANYIGGLTTAQYSAALVLR